MCRQKRFWRCRKYKKRLPYKNAFGYKKTPFFSSKAMAKDLLLVLADAHKLSSSDFSKTGFLSIEAKEPTKEPVKEVPTGTAKVSKID